MSLPSCTSRYFSSRPSASTASSTSPTVVVSVTFISERNLMSSSLDSSVSKIWLTLMSIKPNLIS